MLLIYLLILENHFMIIKSALFRVFGLKLSRLIVFLITGIIQNVYVDEMFTRNNKQKQKETRFLFIQISITVNFHFVQITLFKLDNFL